MSLNDYVVSSNNSINDNKYNAKKSRSTIHQLKHLILSLLKRSRNKPTYRKSPEPEYFLDEDESSQNSSNELLEARIFSEIDACPDFAAVPVYNNGAVEVTSVVRGQRYIPVHFARTDAGTFFWTSVATADSDVCWNFEKRAIISEHQTPESQVPCDRWAQA